MKHLAYFVFLVILLVQGDFNSNFMLRNPSYDNRATNAVHVILTSNSNSRLACASQCTAWNGCKSVMFNMDTHECQLLSVHMDDQSDAGPHTSVGWLYYEKEFGMYFFDICPHDGTGLFFFRYFFFWVGIWLYQLKQYFRKLWKKS